MSEAARKSDELGRVLINPELDSSMSALPSEADIRVGLQHVCFVPIVLKKSFFAND